MISTIIADQSDRLLKPKTIGSAELVEIAENYILISRVDSVKFPNVPKALSDFHQTKAMTNRSNLKILSYFSIIEYLLTHHPLASDRTDSITRQISLKMCLLTKRFLREIHYDLFFNNISELEKVWEILCDFRSLIAHGRIPDFKRDYLTLQSTDNIRLFLKKNLNSLYYLH